MENHSNEEIYFNANKIVYTIFSLIMTCSEYRSECLGIILVQSTRRQKGRNSVFPMVVISRSTIFLLDYFGLKLTIKKL